MDDCLRKVLLSKRPTPPALDEVSIDDDQEDDSLAWTFTPDFMVSKDGHARCFIATAQPEQETRFHAPYLVREVEIQPSAVGKKNLVKEDRKHRRNAKLFDLPRTMRVREEDFKKCGGDIRLLSRCALPRVQPNMQEAVVLPESKRKRHGKCPRHYCFKPLRSIPETGREHGKKQCSVGAGCTGPSASKHTSSAPSLGASHVSSLRLPALGDAPSDNTHSKKERRGKEDSTRKTYGSPRGSLAHDLGGQRVINKRCCASAGTSVSREMARVLGASVSLPILA